MLSLRPIGRAQVQRVRPADDHWRTDAAAGSCAHTTDEDALVVTETSATAATDRTSAGDPLFLQDPTILTPMLARLRTLSVRVLGSTFCNAALPLQSCTALTVDHHVSEKHLAAFRPTMPL
jgi:hypothetical protein